MSSVLYRSVVKNFGALNVLRSLDLAVPDHKFLALLGPSGCGKTTALRILAGLDMPTAGKVFIGERDVTRLQPRDRDIAMVFQSYALYPQMTVAENIGYPLWIRGTPEAGRKAKIGEVAAILEIGHLLDRRPRQLSGGQRQRVALARALVFEPGVLLLDEPFSALDKSLRGQMQAEMKRLHQETGTTFVFVTHDQSEALALSSRVAIFNHGKLLQVGRPDEVYDRPDNRFVAEFLGEINMLPVKGVKPADNGATGLCEDRAVNMRCKAEKVRGDAILAIRPEHMSIAPEAAVGENGIAATAVASTYLGAATKLDLTTRQGAKVTVSVPNEVAAAALSKGNSVWLTWPAEKGFLLPDGGQ
ncbi:MAG: ABC transporter ATP-binding protein [Mesorhizobium sp.]|nr:MAG: ABC transporter ATP-binding protein [Mesorhizobium sp.]